MLATQEALVLLLRGSVTVATGSSATAPSGNLFMGSAVATGDAFDSGSLTLSTGNAYENSGGIYIDLEILLPQACRATSIFK